MHWRATPIMHLKQEQKDDATASPKSAMASFLIFRMSQNLQTRQAAKVSGRKVSNLLSCNYLNLNQSPLRQSLGCKSRTSRSTLRSKELGIDGIKGCKIGNVSQQTGRLHNIGEFITRLSQYSLYVLQRLTSLTLYSTLGQHTRCGHQTKLTRNKNHITCHNSLTVGSNGCWCLRCWDNLFTHRVLNLYYWTKERVIRSGNQ